MSEEEKKDQSFSGKDHRRMCDESMGSKLLENPRMDTPN